MRRLLLAAAIAVPGILIGAAAQAGADGGPSPFVGSWESVDPAPDSSQVRLQIGGTGHWHLRDEQGSVCLNKGFGFVPATAQGVGEFTSPDTFDTYDFDIYCYPRDGQGRQVAFRLEQVGYAYWPDTDILIDQFGTCWWRSGTGDQSNCPAD